MMCVCDRCCEEGLLMLMMMVMMMCVCDRCCEEGSQLKLTEVTQAPLVKQNLDTNVFISVLFFN